MPSIVRSKHDRNRSGNTRRASIKRTAPENSQRRNVSKSKTTASKRELQDESEGLEQQEHQEPSVQSIELELSVDERPSDVLGKPKLKKRRLHGSTHACSICLDDFEDRQLLQLSCRCPEQYCKGCLDQWYTTTLRHKEFPRCCGAEVIDNNIWDLLATRTKRLYSDVLEERYAKVGQDKPLYCASCQGYIRHAQVKDSWGTCSSCKRKTCTRCKSLRSEHKGLHILCPSFLNDSATASLGPNFKRCPRCFILIEKASGCNEMRCKCGCTFEFCCGFRKCQCKE